MADNVGFHFAGDLLGTLADDVLLLVLDVVEVFPERGFHGGVLVLHEGSHFTFMDRIGIGDDTVRDSTCVNKVFSHLGTVLLALHGFLRKRLLRGTDIRHLVTNCCGQDFQLFSGNERVHFCSHVKSP